MFVCKECLKRLRKTIRGRSAFPLPWEEFIFHSYGPCESCREEKETVNA